LCQFFEEASVWFGYESPFIVLTSISSLLQPGHLKVDCPSAPVKENGVLTKACHSCGDVGHLKRDCPKVSPTDLLCFNITAEAFGRGYWGLEEVLAIRLIVGSLKALGAHV
jgi:hypothetical protein